MGPLYRRPVASLLSPLRWADRDRSWKITMLRGMSDEPTFLSRGAGIDRLVTYLSRMVQRNLIWLLIASYAIATGAPALGLWIRDTAFGEITVFHDTS